MARGWVHRMHRANDAHIVDVCGSLLEQFANFDAALTVLAKLERRW